MRRNMCLGLSAAGIAAASFVVCVAGVALAPPAATAVWGAVLGIPLTTLARRLSWERYLLDSLSGPAEPPSSSPVRRGCTTASSSLGRGCGLRAEFSPSRTGKRPASAD